MKTLLLFFALTLAATGCKSPGDEADDTTKKEAIAETPQKEPEKPEQEPEANKPPAPPEPVSKIPGTPHDEEHRQVTLAWAAAAGDVVLARSPGVPSKATAKLKLKKGDAIEYEDSVVLVTEPVELKPKAGAQLHGASLYTPSTDTVDEETSSLKLSPEDDVRLLKYAGEGTCFYRVNEEHYLAVCPMKDTFEGDLKAKPSGDWWVLVAADDAKGWLKVDDRVKVDVKTSF